MMEDILRDIGYIRNTMLTLKVHRGSWARKVAKQYNAIFDGSQGYEGSDHRHHKINPLPPYSLEP